MVSKRLSVLLSSIIALVLLTGSSALTIQRAAIVASDERGLAATDEILKKVSQLRHLEIKQPVKSSARTKEQIEQIIIQDLDENTPPEEFQAQTKLMTKLGLIPAGFSLREYVIKLLREQVAGFYDPKTREFYLAAWLPILDQNKVMVHELVHALQDQHFDLRRFEKWPKGDSDAEMAVHALVEGDATMLMIQYDINEQGIKLDVTRMSSLTELMLADGSDEDAKQYPVLAAAPPVLRQTLQFPYVYGAGFAQAVWRDRDVDGLNRSYRELPASSEQIMHPAKYLVRDEPVKVDQPDLLPLLGSDWKRIDSDVNGEFGYKLLLSEFIGQHKASGAAAGWGGDQYALYESKKNGALLLAQFTTWDTESDAREFFDAYAERTEKRYKLAHLNGKTTLAYSTNEGPASIEIRGKDVAIVEGAFELRDAARLFALLWQSKKSVRIH